MVTFCVCGKDTPALVDAMGPLKAWVTIKKKPNLRVSNSSINLLSRNLGFTKSMYILFMTRNRYDDSS